MCFLIFGLLKPSLIFILVYFYISYLLLFVFEIISIANFIYSVYIDIYSIDCEFILYVYIHTPYEQYFQVVNHNFYMSITQIYVSIIGYFVYRLPI